MKIIHVISSPSPGGAENYIKNLVIKMKYSIDVSIWFSNIHDEYLSENYKQSFLNDLNINKITYYDFKKKPKKNRAKIIVEIIKKVKKEKPDIIHVHSEEITFHFSLAKFFSNFKLVQTIHNKVVYHPFLMKTLFRHKVDYFVLISDSIKEMMLKDFHLNSKKLTTIYNGVPIKKRPKRTIKQIQKIISVGSLTEQKDYYNFLDSIIFLRKNIDKKSFDNLTFDIYGDGPLKKVLIEYSQKHDLNNVNFMGTHSNIVDLLYDYDLFVMSSAWEGLSIALIEAYSTGIPIIATDAGSNNEIIIDGLSGIIVPIKDPRSLSNAMIQLMTNLNLMTLLSNEAYNDSIRFDIKNAAKNHLDLYRNMVINYE